MLISCQIETNGIMIRYLQGALHNLEYNKLYARFPD